MTFLRQVFEADLIKCFLVGAIAAVAIVLLLAL